MAWRPPAQQRYIFSRAVSEAGDDGVMTFTIIASSKRQAWYLARQRYAGLPVAVHLKLESIESLKQPKAKT